MRRSLYFAAPILALAACTPADDAAVEDPVDADAQDVEEVPATLDLQAGGIVIPAQNGFERLEAPFGSNRAATEATLGNIVGEQLSTGEANDGECWLDTVEYEGLTLAFNEEDEFVGYFATPPWSGNGQRGDMLSNAEITMVEDSTLGEEFIIGSGEATISGMFSGEGDDATVESLWAGENCIFR